MDLSEKTNNEFSGKVIKRRIREGAEDAIISNSTKYFYQDGIGSSIREITSNCRDSQIEKEELIEILEGRKQIQDYFTNKEGEYYQDSKLDLSYYDLKWLDKNKNYYELIYKYGGELDKKDSIQFIDYGVGLGMPRLENYFFLGYSSKRNNAQLGGGWGYGSKCLIAIPGCDYYIVESFHNGRRFKFKCYENGMQSMIGKFNLSAGGENKFITFESGDEVYYEDTLEKNRSIVSAELYKYDRTKALNSIQQQLMYFKGLRVYKEIEGEREDWEITPRIIYEDEDIIMSDNSYYNKPHLVVRGCNYGFIDYERIFETEQIYSNIGIKCDISITDKLPNGEIVETQEGLQVTPSRENIINDSLYTRNHLKKKIDLVANKASSIIEKSLQEKDFLKWLSAASAVVTGYTSDEVLKRMKQFVGNEKMRPKFSEYKEIVFSPNVDFFFFGMDVKLVKKEYDYKTRKEKIVRDSLNSWVNFDSNNIYLRTEDHGFIKDFYIKSINPNSYHITVKLLDYQVVLERYLENNKEQKSEQRCQDVYSIAEEIYHFLEKSQGIKDYDAVVVPEDFKVKLDSITEVEQAKIVPLTPEERRRLDSRTVCFSLRENNSWNSDKFTWDKKEPKIGDIEDSQGKEIVWGLGEDEDIIKLAATIIIKNRKYDYGLYIYNDKINLLRVANNNKKPFVKYHSHSYIKKWFKDIKDGKIIMSGEVRKWWTAKLINDKLEDLKFLKGYKSINPEIYAISQELYDYQKENYVDIENKYSKFIDKKDFFKDFIKNCENITNFQLLIESGMEDAGVKERSLELFGVDDLKGGLGIDLIIYNKLQMLLEYASPVKDLFNYLEPLTLDAPLEPQTEMFIHEIVKSKGLDKFVIPDFNKETDQPKVEIEDELILEEI